MLLLMIGNITDEDGPDLPIVKPVGVSASLDPGSSYTDNDTSAYGDSEAYDSSSEGITMLLYMFH